ncbi:MAG: MFS transporter, partial [Proteobacteria bacterium]|nr:MFS transporter [Pseudomonadota bacterium]
VFVFSTAPFLYLFINELWQLALVRFYHGFATAVFIPVAMALVADLFQSGRGEKMGWFSTSTLIGRFIAPIVGGTIIGALVFDPNLSYKFVYIVCGIAGIIAFVFTVKIPPVSEKKSEKVDWRRTLGSFRAVLSNRLILITAMVEASILFAYGTFETFVPVYSIKMGLSAYEVGIFLSSQVLTLALTKPLMGRFSDKYGRKPQILMGVFMGALCIGGFSFSESFLSLLILSIFFGLSLSVVTSATSAFIADLSRKESYGSAMGILGSVMDIGHTLGPLISGIVASFFGFKKAFITASAILIFMGAFFFYTSLNKNKTNN